MNNESKLLLAKKLKAIEKSWQAPEVPAVIPHGDMPGDKVQISSQHIEKAKCIFPKLCARLELVLRQSPCARAVITVCGGSGVGKSEIASLLSYYLRNAGIGSYTLSGDNYPHRIPCLNDAERRRVFRSGGIQGLLTGGLYSEEAAGALQQLWSLDKDADPLLSHEYPWLAMYQAEGRKALCGYLGTDKEQNFAQLTNIISQFKNESDFIWLKRMGRTEDELWYEKVSFEGTQVLILEWTHGNSNNFKGVDSAILLNSTPQETKEHRSARNRDGGVDSPFTTMVLEIEQGLLRSQARNAEIIVSKSGKPLSYLQYCELMALQGE